MDQAAVDRKLAEALGLDLREAASLLEQVTGADSSLNVPVQGSDGTDRLALLEDPASLHEPETLENLEAAGLRKALATALQALPDRERDIIIATQITEPPATLEALGAR